MILAWYWRWIALSILLGSAMTVSGILVANHYQRKLDKIEELGRQQNQRVKHIEAKQAEVVKNVNQTVKKRIADSDAYYRLHFPAGKMPETSRSSGGIDEAAKATPSDSLPHCDPADGAADAITILGWQKFYMDLKAAQKQ